MKDAQKRYDGEPQDESLSYESEPMPPEIEAEDEVPFYIPRD